MLNGRKYHPSDCENEYAKPLRIRRLIREFIGILNLDLSGLVVLTEAASGNYVVTPLIAAMAKAKKVIAVTKNSRYGMVREIVDNTLSMAKSFGIREGSVQIVDDLKPDLIGEADVITNLGFVRPIGKEFICHLKRSAVISLMYETWEFRKHDLDLAESLRGGIPVLGVNEQFDALRIFDYVGHLCMKILFEAGLEIFRSRIVVVGSNEFGKNMIKTLAAAGAVILCATNFDARLVRELGGVKIGDSIMDDRAQQSIKNCDALIVNTYPDQHVVIGESGGISPTRLSELSPEIVIVQFNGMIERKSLDGYCLTCLPREEPAAGHMGWTLAYLGPKPIISLHCGGLKVGELLARGRLRGLDCEATKREALKNSICQDFSPDQYNIYHV